MRYPDEHKGAVRKSILERASLLVRRDGVAGLSVARAMAAAKMTVGGFYRHFASQDVLVGEALAEALRDARARLFAGIEPLEGPAFERGLIERYLSLAHFHERERGCPVSANVSELSRLSDVAIAPLALEIQSLVDFVSERVCPVPSAKGRASMILSSCVGAMALARALGESEGPRSLKLSREALLAGLCRDA